jgi:hypothetical protein
MPDSTSNIGLEYINATDYTKLVSKTRNLVDVAFDLTAKSLASRKLRYSEIDIEVERKAGNIAPDEVYIPTHIIDTNIRREQSSYVQYITQSPRAVILKDRNDASFDLSLLEVDLTEKLRFDGWQLNTYANIDGFQANGYGVMETIQDLNNPGEIGREYVQLGDFSFIADTKDIQKCEMVGRAYFFTRTKLKSLTKLKDPDDKWSSEQVEKLLKSEPNDEQAQVYSGTTTINRSLYKIFKVMFRVDGYVYVGWACPKTCDDWLREPRKLFVGRRKLHDNANAFATKIAQQPPQLHDALTAQARISDPTITDKHISQIKSGIPASDKEYETQYPYFLYPYLISENDTVSNLKGRVFLDQDTQNAVSSLLSSLITKARRSSYLMFAKDTTDPNDDFMMQKNIIAKPGAMINGKAKEFELSSPDPQLFNALNTLVSMNQQETSQVNFAEQNRQQDSRKTATAIRASISSQQQLSGTQVTLFSMATKRQYTYECEIIKSRVLAGLIKVSDELKALYARDWTVKPSGDTDVIEKQQMIDTMTQAWPIMSTTPAATLFLSDLIEKMYPDSAAKYIAAINQAEQQKQSAQGQMLQKTKDMAIQLGQGIIYLSKKPEMFSDTGRVHIYPKIEQLAQQAEQLMKGQQQQ